MRRSRTRELTPFAAGLILILVVGIGTYLGFRKSIPFRHHFTIEAAFKNANNIKKNSFVRIAGVNVGKVTGVRFVGGGQQAAIVSMRLDNAGLPIHTDATALIRPRIFLEGNFFVDVHPGSPSAKVLGDGGMIPINQTSAPVQLDQVLSTLRSSTRTDLQRLLQELSTGFAGQGAGGLNRSIQFWGPAYSGGSIVNDATLGTAQHDLSNYIASSAQVAQALDKEPAALKGLITDFNTTANALAVQNIALGNAIAELPRTLSVGRPALAALNASFPPLRRLVVDLRPAVRSSLPALTEGIPFAAQVRGLVSKPELRGLVAALVPTVPALTQLNIQSVPLYQQVRAAASCQNRVILPWSHQTIQDQTFPATGPVYQEQFKALPGLAGESRSGDANGQWFRVMIPQGSYVAPDPATNQLLLSSLPILGSNPPAPATHNHPPLTLPNGASTETVPCETQQQPDLRTTPLGPPPGEQPATLPNTAAAHAQLAKDQAAAIAFAKKALKIEGLTNVLKVSTTPITASQIPHLRALGTLGGAK
jgi:virulence factor Mce-like protein